MLSLTNEKLRNGLYAFSLAAACSARDSALLTIAYISAQETCGGKLSPWDVAARNEAIDKLQELQKFFSNL